MTLNPDNVRVAITGAVYTAPAGTEVPTTPDEAWPEGWEDLGYLSDDGVEEGYSDDVSNIVAWQNGTIVRKVITGSDATFAFTCIETNRTVLELFHKGSKVETDDSDPENIVHRLKIKAAQPDRRMFGFDVVDGDRHLRIIVEDGEVTERGSITYVGGDAVSYPVTITAYPDEESTVATKLSNDAAWAAPAQGGGSQ